MKIVTVMTTAARGGAEFAAIEMLDALAERGHETVMLSNQTSIERDRDVAVRRIELGPKLSTSSWPGLAARWPLLVRRLRTALRAEMPYDVLLLHYKKEQLLGARLPRSLRAALVWAEWGPVPFPLRHGVPRWTYLAAARQTEVVMAVSPGTKRSLCDVGIPPGKIEIVPNVVRTEEVEFSAQGRRRVRERLGIADEAFVVGCISRFHHKKRNDVVVRAVQQLGDDAHLILAGEGETEPELRELARQLGERALFVPTPTDDLADVLSAFDVSVFCPSPTEGAPRAVILAMLAGRPCLSTGPEGVADIITPGVGEIAEPEDDPAALAAALRPVPLRSRADRARGRRGPPPGRRALRRAGRGRADRDAAGAGHRAGGHPGSVTETLPQIPLFDLRLEPEDLAAVADTLRSGWLTMGPRTEAFERAFAAHLGCRHAVALSSCTAALHLAYRAAGVGPGDEVIVPSMTFAATANAAIYCDATPVFAEILGQHDLSIDPADVARRITPRTKAVAAVHFAGYAAPVDELAALCADRGLALVEDVAHAPSATLDGRRLGTFGLAGCFSFFSNKILSVGEGGLLATDDDEVAATARLLRSHAMTSGTWDRHSGRTDTYDVTALGYNYRLDEPRAALLLSRLGRLEADIARRRELVRGYRARARRPRRSDGPLPRRSGGRFVLLRDADHARRSRAPARLPPLPADRAGRADEPVLPGRARVHRLPRAPRPALAAADRAGRAHGGDDPAVSRT